MFEGEKNKTSKSWRHPLNKPPARSPMTLVKQQAISDEGEHILKAPCNNIFSNQLICIHFKCYLVIK